MNKVKMIFKVSILALLFVSLLQPQVVNAANANVGDEIIVKNLVIKKGSSTGETMYEIVNEALNTTIVPANIEISKEQGLYFMLEWVPKDSYNDQFEDGDWFEIPIVASKSVTGVTTTTYPLYSSDGTKQIATGNFYIKAGTGGEPDYLYYKVVFHADVENYIVVSGDAEGRGVLKEHDNGKIILGDDDDYTEFYYEPAKPGDPTRPQTNDGISIWVGNSHTTSTPTEFYDAYKLVKSGTITSDVFLDHYSSSTSHGSYLALPDRGGVTYPSYRWYAPFYALQEQYELDPDMGPTDGYIIFEDTISANQAFSNFASPAGEYAGNEGATYPEVRWNSSNYPPEYVNDFFAFEIPFRWFGIEGYLHPITNNAGYSARIFVYQTEFTQYVINATEDIYSSDHELLSDHPEFSDLEDAVRNTPLSYAIIGLPSGETKLIVNVGKFGNGTGNPDEGINFTDLSQGFYGGPLTNTLYSSYYGLMKDFINAHDSYLGIVNGTNTPYTHIVNYINIIETDLQVFSNQPGYDAAMADLALMKLHLFGPNGNDGALEGGYVPLPGDGNHYDKNIVWPTSYSITSGTQYPDLVAFISLVSGTGGDPQWSGSYTIDLSGTPKKFGPGYEAEFQASHHLRRVTYQYVEQISGYADKMNNLMNGIGANPSIAEGYLTRRESMYVTAMFHYPGLVDYVAKALSNAGIIADQAYTADELYNTIITSTKWDEIKAIIANAPFYGAFLTTVRNGDSGFSVSSLNFHYNTILIDVSKPIIKNDLRIYMFEAGENDIVIEDITKEYIYAYAAGIRTRQNGGAAFVKVEAPSGTTTGLWKTVDITEFATATGIPGAKFKIYPTAADAVADTNVLTFDLKAGETDTFVYNAAGTGTITEIGVNATGRFYFENLVAGTKYYIKETVAPSTHLLNTEIWEFTATATGLPSAYMAYNVPNTTTPAISTSATGPGGSSNIIADGIVTITDTITYVNLDTTKTYVLEGTLYDASTGLPLLVNGAQVTGNKEFTPSSSSGNTSVSFTFDATGVGEKIVVVFEVLTLKSDGSEVAKHEDINDTFQTVYLKEAPKIRTTAFEGGSSTADKDILVGGNVTITDRVTYENLKIGTKYTIVGTVYDKATGVPFQVNGTPVTMTQDFIPTTTQGFVDMDFTFNSDGLGNKTLVVYEVLLEGSNVILRHEDISNMDQTVKVITKGTRDVPPTGVKTDLTLPLFAILSSICLVFVIGKKRKEI